MGKQNEVPVAWLQWVWYVHRNPTVFSRIQCMHFKFVIWRNIIPSYHTNSKAMVAAEFIRWNNDIIILRSILCNKLDRGFESLQYSIMQAHSQPFQEGFGWQVGVAGVGGGGKGYAPSEVEGQSPRMEFWHFTQYISSETTGWSVWSYTMYCKE